MGGPRINYKKMDKLIRSGKSWKQISIELKCSKSSVVNRAAAIGEQRWKVAKVRKHVEPRGKSFDYLAHLRKPKENTRPLEGLSSYVQGVGK